MVGRLVFYEANSEGEYSPGANVIYVDTLTNANGELEWTNNAGTPVSPKKILHNGSEPNIAYHRARVRRTISFSDLELGADESSAWTFLGSLYNRPDLSGNAENIASVTTVTNVKGSLVEALAKQTIYVYKTTTSATSDT